MPNGNVLTYPEDGRWHNNVEGGEHLGDFDTKEAAVAAGRDEAKRRNAEHEIRNLDGRIGEKNSYGNDPRNIPG